MEPKLIKYCIINGYLKPTEDLRIIEKIEDRSIYEIIRIIEGVPLFLESHLDRMRKSAGLVDMHIYRKDSEIKEDIKKLVLKNEIVNLNVNLLCSGNKEKEQQFLVYFVDSFYPPSEDYLNGIHTSTLHYERENPNAKVLRLSYKERIAKEIKEKNVFEILLEDRDGYIIEGSRSNIFFVRGNQVYTAPTKSVLPGITRECILEVCKDLNIKIMENYTHSMNIRDLDGAFMTGTSVNVLPIATINDYYLNSTNNHIIKEIAKGYMNMINEYINKG